MNKLYNTNTRFMDAATKFPRFMNLRRRPTTSTSGKLLNSIVEEIGAVEEAIFDYKKDFFIVNYLDKAEEYIAYLYQVQIGEIENIDALTIVEPALGVTTDKEEFYAAPEEYAYYQNGYLIFYKEFESITYSYDGFSYKVVPEEFHVWNIFDEFAWWVGLERLLKETNRELMYRTINVFRARPSSSEQGLKNVIKNALLNYGHIDDDEIVFELPNEDNSSLITKDGNSVYDNISSFNRDIARTKKWDIDYWQNDFSKISYLPHIWNSPIANYKDGVGYNDALKISTVKDLDNELGTSIKINGYKKSEEKIEEYFRGHETKKKLKIGLRKYLDVMNPIPVQYRISASTLEKLEYPSRCIISTYKTKNKKALYPIEKLYISDNGVDVVKNNKLADNTKYKVELLPDSQFLADRCELVDADGNSVKNLLREYDQFEFNQYGQLTNRDQKFFANSILDLKTAYGFIDSENGFMTEGGEGPSYFTFETEGSSTKNPNLRLKLNSECEAVSLMGSPSFISGKNYIFDKNLNRYRISDKAGDDEYASAIIEFDGNYLEYSLPRAEASSVQVNTYINGEKSIEHSYSMINLSKSMRTPEPIDLPEYGHIRVEIIRLKGKPAIENIKCKRYAIEVEVLGTKLTAQNNGTYILPKQDKVKVTVTIKNYGKTKFEVNSVIVGKELTKNNSTYESVEFTTGTNQSLAVENLGEVKVYDVTHGVYIDFYPYNSYVNNASDGKNRDIYIDLSHFEAILYTNPKFKMASDKQFYITLAPGESIRTIEVSGSYWEKVSQKSLQEILGCASGDTIKSNNDLKSFVINNDEAVKLSRELLLDKDANIVNVEMDSADDKKFEVVFVIDEDKSIEQISDLRGGAFSSVYFRCRNHINYISYNTENVIQELSRESISGESIKIRNNFSPYIPDNTEVVYFLESGKSQSFNKDIEVLFYKKNSDGSYSTRNWTTTRLTPIQIKLDLDKEDGNLIQYEELALEEEFSLSNHIDLASRYTIDNKDIELDQYIMTIPDSLNIVYEEIAKATSLDEDGCQLYVESDGFNKLPNSNILSIVSVKIDGVNVDPSKYELIGEPGFIWWKDASLYSKPFSVSYIYNKPKYITFSSLDSLYELAGYRLETFEPVNIKEYSIDNLKNGDEVELDMSYFSSTPDKVAITCSNDAYKATVNYGEDSIAAVIGKIGEDNSLVIHNGYYYIDGKEYWYFSDKKYKEAHRLEGLDLKNIEKLGDNLELRKESTNYLKNSKMERSILNPTAAFDFIHYHSIPNVSSANHFGACETLSAWKTYGIKLSPSKDYDGDATIFDAADESSYAILDITSMIRTNKLFTIWFEGKLSFSLGREVLLNNQPLVKSLYVAKDKDFNYYKNKAYLDCGDCDTDNYRYYLIVNGSGVLIEIIVSDANRFNRVEDFEENFIKAIDRFGFKIEEKIAPGATVDVDFSPISMNFNGLELSKKLVLQTGSNVDWGITKIKDYDLVSDILKNQFSYRNNCLTATADGAFVETKAFEPSFIKSIESLILKINDYHVKNLKGFTVQVLGSNSAVGDFEILATYKNTNVVTIPDSNLRSYLKFRISTEENKVITSIELFANYKESKNNLLRVYDSAFGNCVTKIFDLGAEGNYRLGSVEADEENSTNIKYFIRGMRFDNSDNAYTNWYSLEDKHIFNDYRYFQFKVELKSSNAKTRIKKFIMEVV